MRSVNRIPELIGVLGQMADKDNQRRVARDPMNQVGFRLLKEFRDAAPMGQVEPDLQFPRAGTFITLTRGRPSMRLHGVTLDRSWGLPEVEETQRGLLLTIYSTAPHMKWILGGTSAHPEGLSAFHWGSPLRWPAKDGGANGPRIFDHINHPGAKQSIFVDQVMAVRGPLIILNGLQQTMRTLTSPFKTFFN